MCEVPGPLQFRQSVATPTSHRTAMFFSKCSNAVGDPPGPNCAASTACGWKTIDDVVADQMAIGLRNEVMALTATGPASTDFGFRDQIRDCARSVARNLSEGFHRYSHREFAYFTNIARGSLGETLTNIDDGKANGDLSAADAEGVRALAIEALRTITGLLRHLRMTHAPKPHWDRTRPTKQSPP